MKKMRPTLYSHEEMVRHLEAASEAVQSALKRVHAIEMLRDRDSDEPLDGLYTEIAILASTVSYAGEEAHCAAQELSESFEEEEDDE